MVFQFLQIRVVISGASQPLKVRGEVPGNGNAKLVPFEMMRANQTFIQKVAAAGHQYNGYFLPGK